MWKLYFSLLFLLMGASLLAQDTDSSEVAEPAETKSGDSTAKAKKVYLYRIGYDVAKLVQLSNNSGLWQEVQLERINSKNGIMYLETGAGGGSVENEVLEYSTSGFFVRWGLAQNIVYRATMRDVETASIGFRYGGAWCRNSEVKYNIKDPIYGTESLTKPATNMYRHWIEVSMGMKFGLRPKWFLGWTLRGAYKLNSPETTDVSPVLIPGFGRGDRVSAVGFSIYFSYLL